MLRLINAKGKVMRLFIATVSTGTDTLRPMPAGSSGFHDYFFRERVATEEPANLMTQAPHVWRARAEARCDLSLRMAG